MVQMGRVLDSDSLQAEIAKEIRGSLSSVPFCQNPESFCSVTDFDNLVKQDSFSEFHRDGDGNVVQITIEAQIWSCAIQNALDTCKMVHIPARPEPYYIDEPIVMKSGYRLFADENAVIYLKPCSNCCMIRNENIICGQDGPVCLENEDSDVVVMGGRWSTLAIGSGQTNGNDKGALSSDQVDQEPFHSHGVFSFSNIRNFRISNVVFHRCKPHGVQISNARDFIVQNISFEDHRRDGVHINGPASYGLIENIRNGAGIMGDDLVAINAWDWKHTVLAFGPISHIAIEQVDGRSGDCPDNTSEIRFLAGTKHYPNGDLLECNISNCVMRNIKGIGAIKMYDQPNLEIGRDNDFADPIGQMDDLVFDNLQVDFELKEPLVQIASNIGNLAIMNIDVAKRPCDDCRVIRIGPMSGTYKPNAKVDPSSWVEIFSPDKDCDVGCLEVSVSDNSAYLMDGDAWELVEVASQTVNPNYPETTPGGGTGNGSVGCLRRKGGK